MQKWCVVLVALLFAGLLVSDVLAASVGGYYRRDGTYVSPHLRTNPDGNPFNNYSFPGNYNPNTGTITGGDPGRYLDRYYGTQGSSGGFGGRNTHQNPFDFNLYGR